jgi:hypothetical protein
MARRSAADIQKTKEAKQKKLLILLVPVFLALAAWQGPKMYNAFFAKPAEAATPVATTTTTAPATAVPATGAPAPPAGELPDSEPSPAAGSDQLASFERFTARDPFGPPKEAAPPETTETSAGTTASAAATTSAVFDVDGASETVSVGGTFPADDPTFKLVSASESGAVIGLTSGTFESGKETVELAVGEQLRLVGDDGTSFTIALVSVS